MDRQNVQNYKLERIKLKKERERIKRRRWKIKEASSIGDLAGRH